MYFSECCSQIKKKVWNYCPTPFLQEYCRAIITIIEQVKVVF